MAQKFFTLLAALFTATAVAAPLAQANPTRSPAKYDRVFVPSGFDSNDNVQIVGVGTYENACYRPADTTVEVDKAKNKIVVGPAAYKYSGFCLQVVLGFDRVIDVGPLAPGKYAVHRQTDDVKIGEVDVKPAVVDTPDDHLYAPIQQAYFEQKEAKTQVLISGEFPNSCMSLKETKVEVESNVIVVMPIAEMKEGADCKAGHFHFSKLVDVPAKMNPGRYLVHVRSMNAKAINTVVEVK